MVFAMIPEPKEPPRCGCPVNDFEANPETYACPCGAHCQDPVCVAVNADRRKRAKAFKALPRGAAPVLLNDDGFACVDRLANADADCPDLEGMPRFGTDDKGRIWCVGDDVAYVWDLR